MPTSPPSLWCLCKSLTIHTASIVRQPSAEVAKPDTTLVLDGFFVAMITRIFDAWQDLAMQSHGHVVAVTMAELASVVGRDWGVRTPAVLLSGLSHVLCRKKETE